MKGQKETGCKETGRKETGRTQMGGKATRAKDRLVRKYRQLVRTLKQTWVDQIILSGVLPVMGSRGHGYCRRMAVNTLVQQLCKEEEVGFVGMFCLES